MTKWEVLAAKEKGLAPEPRFMESVLASLRVIGVPEGHISTESYG